jgi:hypothetical protein
LPLRFEAIITARPSGVHAEARLMFSSRANRRGASKRRLEGSSSDMKTSGWVLALLIAIFLPSLLTLNSPIRPTPLLIGTGAPSASPDISLTRSDQTAVSLESLVGASR